MKFGTLVQHVPGYKMVSRILLFCPGFSYGLSKSKNGVKLSLNFEKSQFSPGAKLEKSEATFVDLPFVFHSVKTLFVCDNSLQNYVWWSDVPFFDICRVSKVITTAHAHNSGVIFHIFQRAFKQTKKKESRAHD